MRIQVASDVSGTVFLDAFDLADNPIDSATVALDNIAQSVTVLSPGLGGGIAYVVLDSSSGIFVADNLSYGRVCPE